MNIFNGFEFADYINLDEMMWEEVEVILADILVSYYYRVLLTGGR
jgi:hypothetical protein